MITTYTISGMSCGHCEGAVRDELARLDGVTAVEVSAPEGTARVESAASLPLAAVLDAIGEAGYELVDA